MSKIYRLETNNGVIYRYSVYIFNGRGSHFQAYTKLAHHNMIRENLKTINKRNRKIAGK